ncbi:uncharacterized protein LOC134274465, partial [Saccostrea cucullata]|uniref:uncharacterized protein LOC134274465 n=1 Tax=Saccostrea cuccullata TaxID=36930 RepID=UPI002ED5196C
MMASVYSDSVKYIAAVDIGETYSGCALLDMTKKNDTGQNVTNIVWEKSLSQCRAKKTRTCILFNECGNVAEFGYDAEKKFKELLGLGKAQEWYFFQNYKHCLNEPQ